MSRRRFDLAASGLLEKCERSSSFFFPGFFEFRHVECSVLQFSVNFRWNRLVYTSVFVERRDLLAVEGSIW